MVVAEVLTGISLVKASVDFIKSNISTCQDISQIAGQIDDLFRGEKEVQKARAKKSGGSGLGDQFGVDSVAKEIIDAKIAAENLAEVARLVDFRFGHGTWAGIIAERAKRIQEQREIAAAAKRKKIQEAKEFEETMKQFVLAGTIIVIAVGLFIFLMVSVAKAFII